MRVERQGIALENLPAKAEAGRSQVRIENWLDNKNMLFAALSSQEPGKEELQAAVDAANQMMEFSSYHLNFKLHEESGQFQVRLIDNQTKEVIKEIPPDYMLELSAKMKEMVNQILGIFVDELV